jgi:hypothetical protein
MGEVVGVSVKTMDVCDVMVMVVLVTLRAPKVMVVGGVHKLGEVVVLELEVVVVQSVVVVVVVQM